MSSKQRTLLSCAVSGILGVSMTAAAQQSTRTSVLEEVIVTAEKREQNIQEVPVAVSAYTSETRVQLGINTIEDFARMTPSMTYRNDDRLSIRGFGRLTNSIGTDPSVALYSDGIFSTSMADTSTPPLFIERTEILRGPQGTLYGRNSIGGTLNIISKRPTDDFEGEVRVGAGNYSDFKTDVLMRGPFSESLRYLVGGSFHQRNDGYIENLGTAEDSGTSDRWMVEGQIEADLGETAVARLRYSKFEWDDTYGVGNALENVISPYDVTSPTGVGDDALYYNTTIGFIAEPNPAVADPYKIKTNRDAPGILRDHDRIHLDVTWDVGGATVKYLGGYQDYTYETGSDRDGTSRTGTVNVPFPAGIQFPVDVDGPGGAPAFSATAPAFTATGVSVDGEGFYLEAQRWWSNEINISSNGDGAVQWIAGLYQYDQTYKQRQGLRIHNDNALLQPVNSADPNPERNILVVDGLLETKSYAGFGQIDWTFADAWTLTLGARYTQDEKEGWDAARYVSRTINTALGAAGQAIGDGIVAAVRAGQTPLPADAPLSVIQATLVPVLANGAAAGAVPQTQAVALDVTSLAICGGPCPADYIANPGGGLRRNLADDWDAVTGTLGLQWEPSDVTNVYARYSRGYKSGGWYGNGGLPSDIYADPEYANTYEIGWKQLFGGRFQMSTAVFYNDYKDLQAPLTALRPSGTGTSTQFLNLDATTQGVEIETQWSPVDNLQFLLNAAYLDTEFEDNACCFIDSANPTAGLQSVAGNELPLSPKTRYAFGATYTWEFAPGALTFSGLYTHLDEQQSSIFENPLHESPATDVADFRLIWNGSENRYTVVGFVKNAFEEEGYLRSATRPVSAVGPRRVVGPIFPRTYGLEVQVRFGL